MTTTELLIVALAASLFTYKIMIDEMIKKH